MPVLIGKFAMQFEDIIKQMLVLLKKLEDFEPLDKKSARLLPKNGIYVFYENSEPIYVGRSRSIATRIQSHSRQSSDHNSASFAFLLAKEKAGQRGINIRNKRRDLEDDASFSKICAEEKERVSKMKIKAIEIEDPEIQAIFEIYASKMLETKYNDFNTH